MFRCLLIIATTLATLLTAAAPVMAAAPALRIIGLEVLEDPTRQLVFKEAMDSKNWKVVADTSFSGGYSRSAFWLRMHVNGIAGQAAVLTVLPSFLDDLRFYVPAPLLSTDTVTDALSAGVKGWNLIQQGDLHSSRTRAYDWRSFNIKLRFADDKAAMVYLRLQTGSASQIHPQLWSEDAFAHFEKMELMVFGMIFGSAVIYTVLSLLLFLLLREKIFLLYLGYALACCVWYLSVNGFISQYILPTQLILASNLLGAFACLVFATSVLFFKNVMHLEQIHPRINRFLNWSAALQAILAVASIAGWYAHFVRYLIPATLLQWIVVAAICIELIIRQRGVGRYITFSFMIIIASNTVLMLSVLTRLFPAAWTIYLFQGISFIDMTVLLPTILIRFGDIKYTRQAATMAITLANTKLELEKAAREAQRQWVAILTHEIKTPLTVIDASRQTIATLNENPMIRERTDKIERAALRIDALIQSFLTEDEIAQRHQNLLRERIALPVLLKQLCQQLQNEAPQQFHFAGIDDFAIDCCFLEVDPELLLIALRNLLMNGVRHGTVDDTVVLRVSVHNYQERAGILFSFSSSGLPIAAEQQAQLFSRYHRAGAYAGNGIGLWATREIARSHGGNAWYEAGQKAGNCFSIWLPQDQRLKEKRE